MNAPRRGTARAGAGRKKAKTPRAPSGAKASGVKAKRKARTSAATPAPSDGTRERILAAAEAVLRRHVAA
jgi:hypothetical protein